MFLTATMISHTISWIFPLVITDVQIITINNTINPLRWSCWTQTKLATSYESNGFLSVFLSFIPPCCRTSLTGFLFPPTWLFIWMQTKAAQRRTCQHFALPGTVSPLVAPPCLPELHNAHNTFQWSSHSKGLYNTGAAQEICFHPFNALWKLQET